MDSQFELAEALLTKGLAAARDLGAPSAIGGMLCSLGVPLYYTGRYAASAALNAEAARLYELLGRNATASMTRSNLASIALAQGEVASALEHARVAVRLARECGDELLIAQALVNQGEALDESGETDAARATLDEAVALAVEHPLTITDALSTLATIDLRQRAFSAALGRILRIRDILAAHRLAVRVPMLILVAGAYALSAGTHRESDGTRWLQALARLEGVDASLARKALRFLGNAASNPDARAASASLGSLEREVLDYLAGVGRTAT
jgi:tetratricopeptide (TPR) repeat protein